MGTQVISRRYARALFELRGEGVDLRDGLNAIADVAAVPEVREMLASPSLSADVKAQALMKAAGQKAAELMRLVHLLARRGKATLLPEIRDLYEAMVREAEAEVEASVISAVKLDEGLRKKIAAALEKKLGRKVRFDARTDAGILGGLVIRVGDRLIDLSLRTRLDGLRQAIASA